MFFIFKLIFSILLLIKPNYAVANFDLEYGTQFRSYPALGGEFFFQSGKSFALWGSPSTEKSNPWFGLLRFSVGGATSAVVNNGFAQVEFFPISFVGLAAGRQITRSDFDFPFFDCSELYCRSTIEHNFVQLKTGLSLWRFIVLGSSRTELMRRTDEVTHSDPDKEDELKKRKFGDFRKVIEAGPTTDRLDIYQQVYGLKFGQSIVGYMHEFSQMEKTNQASTLKLGVWIEKLDNSELTFGAGVMETSYLEKEDFIMVFRWSSWPFPSWKLL